GSGHRRHCVLPTPAVTRARWVLRGPRAWRKPRHDRLEADRLPRSADELLRFDLPSRRALRWALQEPGRTPGPICARSLAMPTLPKVDVVFVGFGMVAGIIANELSKRATNLKKVGLEIGSFRKQNPDLSIERFDSG